MEFNEKLYELRKKKGFTQEQLANALYVSRTAISKWESGRGYPNIDSLKRIAELFSITLDELLSSEQVLCIAQQDNKEKQRDFLSLSYGLIDICVSMLLFLPFFAQRVDGVIKEVSLLSLNVISPFLSIIYYFIVALIVLLGIFNIIFQNCHKPFWLMIRGKMSLILNVVAALVFILSLQPYAAVFLFILLIIKIIMLTHKSDT